MIIYLKQYLEIRGFTVSVSFFRQKCDPIFKGRLTVIYIEMYVKYLNIKITLIFFLN